MPQVIKNIPIVGFLDKDGLPTCAANFQTGEVCIFYRVQRLGCHETCVFAEEAGYKGLSVQLKRRGDGFNGSLIPCKECLIWKERVEPS